MPGSIILERTGGVVASDLRRARGWRAKRRGLLAHEALAEGEALLLGRAPHVHTIGMGFPIDVVFCDREGRVLRIARRMPPGRYSPLVLRARYTLELAAGGADEVEVGDTLVFER